MKEPDESENGSDEYDSSVWDGYTFLNQNEEQDGEITDGCLYWGYELEGFD